jgi:hypothetical protein
LLSDKGYGDEFSKCGVASIASQGDQPLARVAPLTEIVGLHSTSKQHLGAMKMLQLLKSLSNSE